MTEIQNIAILGAGTMGHALALVHALGGCKTRIFDNNPEVANRALKLIDSACSTLIKANVITSKAGQKARTLIELSDTFEEAVSSAELIIEAVVEKPEIKRVVFHEIDRYAPTDTIIASNTSYLDIFPLLPERRRAFSAIAHWYAPPYIIDLVDIAPGPETSPDVVKRLFDLYKSIGKQPLVFSELVPGYVANRLQAALNLECLRMIDEGWVSAEDIDFSIRYGLVGRLCVLGHMRKMDYTGLEMVRNGIAARQYHPPENSGATPTLDKLIQAGRSGVRAGAGFFDYGDLSAESLFQDRDLQLLRAKTYLETLQGDK